MMLRGGQQVPIPETMAHLALDKHGRPIPWFVVVDDRGNPDHRAARKNALTTAIGLGLCWMCGRGRGSDSTFLIGPMCTVNRVTAEPPMHHDCALYAVQVCPFLATPSMRRLTRNLPQGYTSPGGRMIHRNPGVVAAWSTSSWTIDHVGNGLLFDLGDPVSVSWFAQGRQATREEVSRSLKSRLLLLISEAESNGGDEAVGEAKQAYRSILPLLPGEEQQPLDESAG